MHHIARQKEDATKYTIEPIYEQAAKMIPDADWYIVPRLIKILCPDVKQAELLLHLPATSKAIAEKLGVEEAWVESTLQELKMRGLIIAHPLGFKMHCTVGGFVDFTSTTPYSDKYTGDEFYELLGTLLSDPDHVKQFAAFFSTGNLEINKSPVNRVLPKWRAIKDIPGLMPAEDLREICKGKMSTSRCMCRMFWPKRIPSMYDGVYPDEGHCLHFGNMADYYVNEMKLGKYLTPEEAFKLMDELADKPTVHVVSNDRQVGFICQCCDDSCMITGTMYRAEALGAFKMEQGVSPSRFVAVLDNKKCSGCTSAINSYCISKCQFHALSWSANGKVVLDSKKCYGCGTCAVACPGKALTMKLVRPPEHIPEHGLQWVETFYLQPDKPVVS
jgi:Fe-S-cluster-containing hydrogenase component 2